VKPENINYEFLNGVLDGSHSDVYYHFGVSSGDELLERMRGVRAVILAGSGERIEEFARRWSTINAGADIIEFPKTDRFVARYCADVLFSSHGMGMPSASIAMQELMRLVFFLKGGDLDALDDVFWARVGTSGGVGLDPGTVVLTTEAVMVDLRPYRLLNGGIGEYWFDCHFPQTSIDAILAANAVNAIPLVTGKTVAANEFFLEQFRLDGAIRMETAHSKLAWLEWIHEHGVRNIEMEGALVSAYLNHWGFTKFAMICATLLNRLDGDQVTSSPARLHQFSEDSGRVLFNYLAAALPAYRG